MPNSAEPHEHDHFIEARPQIAIMPNAEDGTMVIRVTSMDVDAESVRVDGVIIPGDCIEEVARAMLRSIGK